MVVFAFVCLVLVLHTGLIGLGVYFLVREYRHDRDAKQLSFDQVVLQQQASITATADAQESVKARVDELQTHVQKLLTKDDKSLTAFPGASYRDKMEDRYVEEIRRPVTVKG